MYLQKLRTCKSNTECYKNLQKFITHLWETDEICDDVYDDICSAIKQYAAKHKALQSTTKTITVKYRFIPREPAKVERKYFGAKYPTCMDVERRLSNGKWDFAHYFDIKVWDFTKVSENDFWNELKTTIECDGYKGYTYIPSYKYKDATYEVLDILDKEINFKTWTGKCTVNVKISNIH